MKEVSVPGYYVLKTDDPIKPFSVREAKGNIKIKDFYTIDRAKRYMDFLEKRDLIKHNKSILTKHKEV